MKKLFLVLSFIALLSSCTKEFVLDASVSPIGAGTVIPSEGTYKEGSTVTLNAAPKGEYLFDRWSGDASGSSSSIDILVDGNKNVTANFILKKYELTLQVDGKGDIIETIVNTGKKTDYDSGTTVKLEAVPSTGYYFSGWSFDTTSEANPIEVKIDRPKTIKATFKKLSYELKVLTKGEGTIKEEIINTSKSTDYEFETTVRLTATPEQGSDFIEWEESGATNEVNPFEIIVTEPKTITAVFEYGLFNKGVGKWKIRKPKIREGSQKSVVYNVYSIIFNRNRSFRLNYSSGQISGTYSVTSNSSIVLNNVGSITNIQINQGQISFNLNITGLFQFNVVGSKVQTYQQNRTYIPDQNFEQTLVDAGYDTTIDSYIDDSSLLGVNQLDLSNRQITDFTGLEEFVNLTDLNLSGNTITSVPLVNLNQLTTLNLSSTGLTELDLSQNSNITSLDLSGNTGLSCVKVSQQIYQQVPPGWTYDSITSFELECDCPTLTLTSGTPSQTLCDGDSMQSLVYDFGGTGTTVNVGTMPSGLQSSISSGTLTLSGTPVFTNNDYSFSVFTTDGNTNCSQVSQTVTLSKKDSPLLTLISGAYNQTITLGDSMQPIVFSFGGSTTSVTITGPEPQDISQSGNTITIFAGFDDTGTNTGTITTISSGGCNEITQSIAVTVNATVANTTGGTTTGGTTTGGTTTSNIAFDSNGICKCAGATVGDTATIGGTLYTVVDNSTIAGQIANGNYNLCTTLATYMTELFVNNTSFNSDISFWDMSNVTNTDRMFQGASSFNQNIGGWNTSKFYDVSSMFKSASSFNQNIGDWDTSRIANMAGMFNYASSFNQDLTGWCVSNIASEPGAFAGNTSALTNANKPIWGSCPTSFSLDVTASNSSDYTLSGTDRNGNISGSDPNLTFSVGDTISFVVNASGHPFYLKTVAGTGTGDTISGINNNGTTNQTISWTPTSSGTYYYQCSLHGGMVGTITIQ